MKYEVCNKDFMTTLVKDKEVESTELSWRPQPGITYEEWEAVLYRLLSARDLMQFLIGDCLNAGDDLFGEDAAQALDPERDDYHKLRKWRQISRAVKFEIRISNLTWSHHYLVAPYSPQAQQILLAQAIEYNLNVAAFRDHIKDFFLVSEGKAPRTIEPAKEKDGSYPPSRTLAEVQELQAIRGRIDHLRWLSAIGGTNLPATIQPEEDRDLAIYNRINRDGEHWTMADHCLHCYTMAEHKSKLGKLSAKEQTFEQRRTSLIALYEMSSGEFERYANIARTFPEHRRRQSVTIGFTHHALLVNRSRDEQEYYLDLAATHGLSASQLEAELKGGRA